MHSRTSYCRRPAIPGSTTKKVVAGFRLPEDYPPTRNELAWIELLRLLVDDADPPSTLPALQTLRAALARR